MVACIKSESPAGLNRNSHIRVKVQAEEIYWAVQRAVKPAYAKLDLALLSNEQKAAAYRLAMGWAITWLAQTAPLDGELFGSKINNL